MKKRKFKTASEEEIDQRIIGESEDDSSWEKPIRVKRPKSTPLQIPGELAARVAFLAKLHRDESSDAWLERIIEERVEFEEALFGEFKRDVGRRRGS
jgi:hypothetical protein